MKQNLLQKISLTLCICVLITLKSFGQRPGLIISELHINPAGADSPFEYAEFRATKFINFATTPYSVVLCNNGTATAAGWIAGGALSYGFSINTGTVNPGDVVYVGGSSMAPTGVKLRVINTGTTAGDGFGNLNTGGVFGNGGTSADGIAVFDADIATLTNSTVPIDALFYGTAVGSATTATGGYELPINDLYAGGKMQSTSFLGGDPGAVNLVANGVFDTLTNTYITGRLWNIAPLTDGTSTVILSNVPLPATIAFSTDNQTVSESVGTVTTNITIAGSNSNPSSVEVVVIPFGTAIVGSDLAYTTQTVTFPANATGSLSIAITINDDALIESSEYFVLKFQNPVNASFAGNAQQTIYIQDNENGTPVGNNDVSMNFVSSFSLATVTGTGTVNSAEIVAHDPASQRLFVANSIGRRLDIVDFSNPTTMSVTASIDISTYGNINSVAVKNGIVACAIENATPELDGYVVFFNTSGVYQNSVTVGALPDMVTFNNAGTRVLTANEGQPNVGYTIDPEGSVSIIDISGGIAALTQTNVTTALFTAFNGQMASLKASGVRIYGPGATVAQDMEPEYIAVSNDDLTAYVTLQENNAIAYVNLSTNTITDIKPLGYKNYSIVGNGLDATDVGTNVNIANWPIKGMYLPDGMTRFNVGGTEYLITANEGDARADYGAANNEETSIGAATYSLDPVAFPNASVMKANANLGKLKCTNKTGDTDNDGDFDEIYTFGARSFSIWNATTGALVYDSGDDLEQITANDPTYGAMFNASNANITKKNRSDDKGPEPEGVTVGTIAGNLYAFVSMERVGGLMAFNINNPAAPQFSQYVNNRGLTGLTGDRGPEGIIYITQPNSPTGKAYIVLGNEVSSTISVYEIACPSASASVASATTPACVGNTVALNSGTISGATYTWYDGSTPLAGATSATYNATVTGNYSVKLDNVGCTIPSNSVSLTFNAIPTLSLTASSNSICSTQTLSLTISGASTYTWTDGSNNATYTATPSANVSYSVIGTDINNCVNTASISITVNTTPTVQINASQLAICPSETATLSLSGASTYTWTDNSNNTTYTVSPTTNTTYSVIGTSANGCLANSVITITANSSPSISISASNSIICTGESVVLTASSTATSYTWSNGVSTMSITVSPTITTVYSVTVTDGLCNNSSSITQSVSLCTSLNELSNNNSINIYPNPFNESFNLSWDSSLTSGQETQIYVYNALGSLQLQTKTTDTKITISTKDWNSGSYFIKINTKAYKIIKQ
jgi:hypothetical protein